MLPRACHLEISYLHVGASIGIHVPNASYLDLVVVFSLEFSRFRASLRAEKLELEKEKLNFERLVFLSRVACHSSQSQRHVRVAHRASREYFSFVFLLFFSWATCHMSSRSLRSS